MSGSAVELPAFAKINLGLELLGRRPDGYTELRTVYQTVSLPDRLRLRLTRAPELRVAVRGGEAPAGRANLIHTALAQARRRLGVRRGIEAELEKNIPVARGLGGGSSDAAAAILGLLRLTRTQLSLQELKQLGAAVGADVPFFFTGGRALGVGRGDEVHPLPEAPGGRLSCVLVCPRQQIATAAAYAWAEKQGMLTPRRKAATMARLGSLANQLWATGNDFEPVVFARFPALARIKAALEEAGADLAGLSGSGSTVYGLFERRVTAQRAAARFRVAEAVFIVDLLPRGAYRRALGLPPGEDASVWGVVQR